MSPSKDQQFDEFMTAVSPRLLALGYLLTSDRSASEDLVQESLTRMYAIWWRLRVDDASSYARRVMINLHRETWRKRGKEIPHEVVPDSSRAVAAADSGRHLDLVDVLQQLPEREREAVVLRHYADLSEREAADAMRCSVGNVKACASRGLAKLRDLLDAPTTEGDRHAHL